MRLENPLFSPFTLIRLEALTDISGGGSPEDSFRKALDLAASYIAPIEQSFPNLPDDLHNSPYTAAITAEMNSRTRLDRRRQDLEKELGNLQAIKDQSTIKFALTIALAKGDIPTMRKITSLLPEPLAKPISESLEEVIEQKPGAAFEVPSLPQAPVQEETIYTAPAALRHIAAKRGAPTFPPLRPAGERIELQHFQTSSNIVWKDVLGDDYTQSDINVIKKAIHNLQVKAEIFTEKKYVTEKGIDYLKIFEDISANPKELEDLRIALQLTFTKPKSVVTIARLLAIFHQRLFNEIKPRDEFLEHAKKLQQEKTDALLPVMPVWQEPPQAAIGEETGHLVVQFPTPPGEAATVERKKSSEITDEQIIAVILEAIRDFELSANSHGKIPNWPMTGAALVDFHSFYKSRIVDPAIDAHMIFVKRGSKDEPIFHEYQMCQLFALHKWDLLQGMKLVRVKRVMIRIKELHQQARDRHNEQIRRQRGR